MSVQNLELAFIMHISNFTIIVYLKLSIDWGEIF